MKPLGLVILSAVLALPSFAEITLTDPGFPAAERLVYREQIGGRANTVEMALQRRTEGTKAWLEWSTKAADAETAVRFDPRVLFPQSIDATTRTKDAVIRRQTEFMQNLHTAASDELVIADLPSLVFSLRGFPFGKVAKAKLVFLGANASSGDYSLELNVLASQKLTVAAKVWDCFPVEIGLTGIYGPFVGKTKLWFASAAPHILVRSEGPIGGPGSPLRTLELVTYEGGS